MDFVWILIYLPVVGAIIGWTCKWVAIKMLWHPEKFVGIGPLGWQGVIQRRAPKFAKGVADTVVRTGITVDALLQKIDGAELAEEIGPRLDQAAPALVRDVAETVRPGLWDTLDEGVRQMVLLTLQGEARRIVATLVTALRPVLVEVLDVEKIIVARLSGENSNRLARLFQTVGKRELEWVIYYGAVLGFIIGVVEVAGYAFLEKWWVLPLAGAFDGVVNNWLAIRMIFRPLVRTKYLGVFPYQGLFPARQQEIAAAYAQMMATEVLGPKELLEHVTQHGGERLFSAALETVEREIESQVQMLSMLTGVEVTPEVHEKALTIFVAHLQLQAPALLPELQAYLEQRLQVQKTIEDELARMPKAEFEEVLRGVFEEDERTLIIIGGFLGGAIGCLQAALMLVF